MNFIAFQLQSVYLLTICSGYNVLTHINVYLEQSGLDVLIIHELGKDEEFLPQKLVCKVDLKEYMYMSDLALFV